MSKKNLFILDGHALAYRAYYAMFRNPLTNSEGQPTSAVYGLANYILRLLQRPECTHMVIVFDAKVPSFRKDIYNEYKANRSEMPDDMKSQMPLLFELVKCLNIPHYVKDGFEADDIIAYLAKKAEAEDFNVSLITKDKDLMQLVSKKVRMLAPESGGRFTEFKESEVENKMGVPPEKVLDLLALMGDSADNIPGLPGVGPKTAVKMITKAGSVDNLIENASILENKKLQAKVEDNIEQLKLSKVLVTLNTDVGIDVDIESLKVGNVNKDESAVFFKKMEFESLLKNPVFDVREETKFSYKTVFTEDLLVELIKKIESSGFCSIDTETTSLDPHLADLVGISLAVDTEEGWYIPLGHKEGNYSSLEQALKLLKPMIESESILKIGQNLKYDYQIFKKYGISLNSIFFDTMVAAYVVDPGKRQYGMDALAASWLDTNTISIEELIGKGKKQILFSEVPVEKAAPYASEDAVIPLRLKEKIEPILHEKGLFELFKEIEMPCVTVLAEMEWNGIALDSALLGNLSESYTKELEKITKSIYETAGMEFNLNSPKQVSEVLFEKLNLPKSKKTKTGLSTNVQALEKLSPDYPIAGKMLEYREVQKLLSTYIDALPNEICTATNRVHTSFNQTVTTTGRLSSTGPNLQNVPVRTEAGRKIREAFIAKEGSVVLSADYSQIELRLLAHFSKDSRLVEAFKQDLDIHTQTASAMYNIFPEMVTTDQRRAAKTINFGLMYGMGPIKLSRELGISFGEAKEFIDTYFEQFPTIQTFMDDCVEIAREKGFTETLLGRKRFLPDIHSANGRVREAAERVAVNTPVQGTAADIMKIAMINIANELDQNFETASMLLQVHDELVFEVSEKESDALKDWVINKMSSAYEIAVPLKVEAGIGLNWNDAH